MAPVRVAAVLARRGRGRFERVAVEPVAHDVVVELLGPDQPGEGAALDRRRLLVEHRVQRGVEAIGFGDARVEAAVEVGVDAAAVRIVGQAQPHRARLARLERPAVVQRGLGPGSAGVDAVAVLAAHRAVDPALDVRRGRRDPEGALVVGLVLAEQRLARAAVAEEPMRAERGVLGDQHAAARRSLAQRRARHARLPRPLVAEPPLRQQVQRRADAGAVGDGEPDQHVVDVALGVLHHHVEVGVVGEDAGVDQLVLTALAPAARVLVAQLRVGKGPLRVAVQPLEVRVRGNGVEVPPVFLDVLAVVALRSAQPVQPLLEDLVVLVPQRRREAQPLVVVGQAEDAVLAPAVRPQPRLLERKVVPGGPVGAVVLAHGAPLAIAQVRSPAPPVLGMPRRRLDPRALGIAIHVRSSPTRAEVSCRFPRRCRG